MAPLFLDQSLASLLMCQNMPSPFLHQSIGAPILSQKMAAPFLHHIMAALFLHYIKTSPFLHQPMAARSLNITAAPFKAEPVQQFYPKPVFFQFGTSLKCMIVKEGFKVSTASLCAMSTVHCICQSSQKIIHSLSVTLPSITYSKQPANPVHHSKTFLEAASHNFELHLLKKKSQKGANSQSFQKTYN